MVPGGRWVCWLAGYLWGEPGQCTKILCASKLEEIQRVRVVFCLVRTVVVQWLVTLAHGPTIAGQA